MEFRWGLLLFYAVFACFLLLILFKGIIANRIRYKNRDDDYNTPIFFFMTLILFIIFCFTFSHMFLADISGNLTKYAVVDNNLYSQNDDCTYTLDSHNSLFLPPKKEKNYTTSTEDKDLIVVHKVSGDEQYKRVYKNQCFYYGPIKDAITGEYIFEYLGKIKNGIVIKRKW